MTSSRTLTLSLALSLLLVVAARAAPPEQTAAAVPQPLTPQQAQQAITVLEDPHKRAELLQTLHAIAQAAPAASTSPAADAPQPATPPSGETQAAPAPAAPPAGEEKPAESPIPLTSGGLVAQLMAFGSAWFAGLSNELVETAQSATRLDVFVRWIGRVAQTPEDRDAIASGAWRLVLVLIAGFFAEWLATRALRSPLRRRGGIAIAQDHPPPAHLLHRLPLAIARMVLDLLPVGAFAAVGNFLVALLGTTGASATVLLTAINAYAIWRGITVFTHSLVSPGNPQLRLFAIGDDVAHYFERWVARLAGVAVFGLALVSIAGTVGLYPPAYRTLNNLVLLAVHILLVVVVIQSRHRVAGWIQAPASASGGIALIRNRLSPIWYVIAIFFILGSWMVDAVEIQNGYVRLMRYLFLSGLVLLGARILSILILGALDRGLGRVAPTQAPPGQGTRPPSRLSVSLHRTARTIVAALVLLALLEVWGVDALAWFEAGAIGRRLLSAAMTIAFAGLAGMALWEWVNAALERQLHKLAEHGEHARLARMRTLLPILRTALFVVLLLVIGLTGLSEIGVNIAPLLAGAGIIGIAVGFGSQKLVQDLITGIFLLVENAFQVGDWVTVAGLSGNVEHLSIRSVRLRSVDGAVHIVPFSSVSAVTNASRDIGVALVSVTVPPDEDTDKAGELLREIGGEMRREPRYQQAILGDLKVWGIDKLDATGATITGEICCTVEGRWKVQREFTRRVKQRFQEAGVRLVAAVPATPSLPA